MDDTEEISMGNRERRGRQEMRQKEEKKMRRMCKRKDGSKEWYSDWQRNVEVEQKKKSQWIRKESTQDYFVS